MIDNNYAKKIKELSAENKLLLGLCYTERSQKLVEAFDEFYHESLSQHFIDKLNKAFYLLLSKQPVTDTTKKDSKELEEILPDSDDYSEMQGGLALNGLSMLCYCYRYLLTNKYENIIYTLNLAFEILDAIGSETNENYCYEKGCQREFSLLDKYLEIMNGNTMVDEQSIALLRNMSTNNTFIYTT